MIRMNLKLVDKLHVIQITSSAIIRNVFSKLMFATVKMIVAMDQTKIINKRVQHHHLGWYFFIYLDYLNIKLHHWYKLNIIYYVICKSIDVCQENGNVQIHQIDVLT